MVISIKLIGNVNENLVRNMFCIVSERNPTGLPVITRVIHFGPKGPHSSSLRALENLTRMARPKF